LRSLRGDRDPPDRATQTWMQQFRGKVSNRAVYINSNTLRGFTSHAGEFFPRIETVPQPVSFAFPGNIKRTRAPSSSCHGGVPTHSTNKSLQLPFQAEYRPKP